jgi:hypothetical protein
VVAVPDSLLPAGARGRSYADPDGGRPRDGALPLQRGSAWPADVPESATLVRLDIRVPCVVARAGSALPLLTHVPVDGSIEVRH